MLYNLLFQFAVRSKWAKNRRTPTIICFFRIAVRGEIRELCYTGFKWSVFSLIFKWDFLLLGVLNFSESAFLLLWERVFILLSNFGICCFEMGSLLSHVSKQIPRTWWCLTFAWFADSSFSLFVLFFFVTYFLFLNVLLFRYASSPFHFSDEEQEAFHRVTAKVCSWVFMVDLIIRYH